MNDLPPQPAYPSSGEARRSPLLPHGEPLLVLLGSTASGKEASALEAAPLLAAEILCADSVKPYRGLRIASAAPDDAARARVRHHLAETLDPRERLHARRWSDLVAAASAEVRGRGRRPLLVGGTALYLRAHLFGVFEGPSADLELRDRLRAEETAAPGSLHARLASVDPAAAAKLHPNDTKRLVRALEVHALTGRPITEQQVQWSGPPAVPYLALGLRRTREDLRRRIDARVARMDASGLFDEIRALVAADAIGPTAAEAIGVKELVPVVRREIETGAADPAARDAALTLVRKNTWTLARRQDTWWRRFPGVEWIDVPADESPAETGLRVARNFGLRLASHTS